MVVTYKITISYDSFKYIVVSCLNFNNKVIKIINWRLINY